MRGHRGAQTDSDGDGVTDRGAEVLSGAPTVRND